MRLLPVIIALAAWLLSACSSKPNMVLDEEHMGRLVADLELANAFVIDQSLGQYATDSARIELRNAVLAKHGVNEAILDSSFRWYGRNLPEYTKVLNIADSILLDSLHTLEAEERMIAAVAAGDSLSLWAAAPSQVFARNLGNDFVTFEVEADSTWRRGDRVGLQLSLHNASSPLTATMVVDYANRDRTSDAMTMTIYPEDRRRLEMNLQLDSNISAKRIYGYITVPVQAGERAFADSIRLVRTRMVRSEYNQGRRYARRITRSEY